MMDGRDGIVSEKCREKALRLLEMRPHASGEIRLKLRKNRDFPPAVIEEIISDFTRVGLLNDRQFVALFCEEKKSAMTPPGRYKVALALRRKGLPADIINEVIDKKSLFRGTDTRPPACACPHADRLEPV